MSEKMSSKNLTPVFREGGQKVSVLSADIEDLTNEEMLTVLNAWLSAVDYLGDICKKTQNSGTSNRPIGGWNYHSVRTLIQGSVILRFRRYTGRMPDVAFVDLEPDSRTVYLCSSFWKAPDHLDQGSKPTIIIQSLCLFLDSESLAAEFPLKLKHKGQQVDGHYSCCGETAVDTLCKSAIQECQNARNRAEIRKHTESLILHLEQVFLEGKKLRDAADTLRKIADDLDEFHRNATIANTVGSTAGISGGLVALGGLLLVPVTGGASLVAAAVGLAVSTAGGVTSAGASAVDAINSKMDKDKVEALLKECQAGLEKIKQNMEVASHLAKKITIASFGKDLDVAWCIGGLGVGCGQVGLHVTKLLKTFQVLEGGRLFARIAGSATVVFSAFFVVFDLLSLIHSGKELSRGAPSELATAIRKAEGELRAVLTELQLAVLEQSVPELRASLTQ